MNRPALFASLLTLSVLGGAAQAADSPGTSAKISTAFGNTVVSIYPDGRSQKIWLKDDGTWTGLSRRGNALAGTWNAKGDQVCLKQTKPSLPFGHFCQAFPDDPTKGIDSKDLTGTKIHLKLIKGHVTKSDG